MTNESHQLLAKSLRAGRPPLTLQKHLKDTQDAAAAVFRLEGRWGRNWCNFFRLEGEELKKKFLLNLQVAGLFHDIGKANEDFYAALFNSKIIQTLRHEHLSALLLHLPEVRAWLKSNPLLDVEIITAAVLSHHLKAARDGDRKWCAPRTLKKRLKLHFQDPQVTATLHTVREIANLPPVPKLGINTWAAENPLWLLAKQDGFETADRFGLKSFGGKERRALLLAVKAGVIIADSVASGLVREGHPFDWIEKVVHAAAISGENIKASIIAPRIEQLSKKKPFRWQPFQEQAADLDARTLLIAPCGSGKTLAAWKWAEAQARSREVGRVIFLYPTRGTATEGFRDYVGWAPEAEAKLVHRTSRYELEAMQENPERASEATRGKNFRSEADDRLFALGLWKGRYFSATVDQFLGFMEHSYSALCLLPALADSILIIDEVHSFDRQMFRSLIAFLDNFDVPILCMTATLPPSRQAELQRAGLRLYPTSDDLKNRAELESFKRDAAHPRYAHAPLPDRDAAFVQAVEAYRQGERVLWVVNTVDRCQVEAEALNVELGGDVINYHSRYKLEGRKIRHEQTIDAFQQIDRPALAVTTQVCEMSLDLDADVLITEVAPVSSLIQRFGRANRHRARGADFRARLFTYETESPLPYTKDEIQKAKEFLSELGISEVSQQRLTDLLERHSIDEPRTDGSSRFLDSGYFATPGTFRDGDEYTRPCVLDEDLKAVQQLLKQHKPYDQFIVTIPERFIDKNQSRPEWLPKYLSIAPAKFYTKEYGYRPKE
jgi:CRISPR-associated endonuclease/helicase Cas3